MSQAPARLKVMKLEELLKRDVWDVDEERHIEVLKQDGLPIKALQLLCPMGCYSMAGEKLLMSYEGCVECGTCRVLSRPEQIRWEFPKSGRGIQYRYT
ncbi:MAG: 4Fe-4S dicluster domain-containing protein [Acidilobaceae archaeon]